jgi:hypothetical protein
MLNMAEFPDLTGYDLDHQVLSTGSRIIILWFSKIERETECWKQIQVTLVGARLNAANLEIFDGFPRMNSCVIYEMPAPRGTIMRLDIHFDAGEISFEFDKFGYSEYSRKINIIRGSEL